MKSVLRNSNELWKMQALDLGHLCFAFIVSITFIFTCNSTFFTAMGGLIVKEMLSRNDDLLDKTVGIMFMGKFNILCCF